MTRSSAGEFEKAVAVWRARHHKKLRHRSVCEAVKHWIHVWSVERRDGTHEGVLGVYECRWSEDKYEVANQIVRGWRAGYGSRTYEGSAGRHWHVGHQRDTVDKGLPVGQRTWRRNRG